MPAQLLEICCDSPASVRLALLGGADRVELCARSSLAVGGLTPSVGLAARSLAHCSPHQLVAMVRCRCGDFNYDAGEVDEMCHDVAALRARGVTTFAFGALTPDGSVDAAALGRIAAAIGKESKLVFHRAIDELLAACFSLQEIDALVQQLALLGVCRILSSGGADSALKGRSTLFVLQKTCERHGVELCVAGGVRRGVAAALRATGAMQFHAASAVAEIIHRGAAHHDSETHYCTRNSGDRTPETLLCGRAIDSRTQARAGASSRQRTNASIRTRCAASWPRSGPQPRKTAPTRTIRGTCEHGGRSHPRPHRRGTVPEPRDNSTHKL